MKRMLACSLLALCMLHTGAVHAARAVTFDVPRTGGVFTVKVHPDLLTVLYFSEEIVSAYAFQEPRYFVIVQHQRSITVQAMPRAVHGNVNVATSRFHVAVLLEVVAEPMDAVLQARFRDQETIAVFEQRGDRELEKRLRESKEDPPPAASPPATKQERPRQKVRDKAFQRVARGLLAYHRDVRVSRGARNRTTSFRLHRVSWIGQDAYLFFSIENRGDKRYLVGTVELRVDGRDQAAAVVFARPTAVTGKTAASLVMPRARAEGVVVFPDARKWRGDEVTAVLMAGPDFREDLSFTFMLPL